jgi:hypothetical protein
MDGSVRRKGRGREPELSGIRELWIKYPLSQGIEIPITRDLEERERRKTAEIIRTARAGKGASAFICPGERIEPKVLRLFGKIARQDLNNISINWVKARWNRRQASPPPSMGPR